MIQLQGYIQSATMELSMQQTVSHLLVSTREACSIFEQNQLTLRNMQDYRVMIYGIEDSVIVRTKIFAKQFHSQSDWTS